MYKTKTCTTADTRILIDNKQISAKICIIPTTQTLTVNGKVDNAKYIHVLAGNALVFCMNKQTVLVPGQGLLLDEETEYLLTNIGDKVLKVLLNEHKEKMPSSIT